MPTEEEFRLYERMDGGTGDIAQDAHVAKHLQRIVNVPEREIVSFVRTRDRDMVHKLREVLKDMPRGGGMVIGGPRAGTRPLPSGMAAMHTEQTRSKIQDIASAWKSNYSHQCNGPSGASLGPAPSKIHGEHIFDGIVRNGFQPHFDRWRSQADESKIAVFAEACRSLKVFQRDTSGGQPSCYREMYAPPKDTEIHPPPVKNNVKNLSVMTIYKPTKGEKAALAVRDQAFRDMLVKARGREKDVLDGIATHPRNRMRMSLCSYPGVPEATSEQCLKPDLIKSRDWKSDLKHNLSNDVHNPSQRTRLGAPVLPRGVTKLKLEGCAADVKRRPFASGHHGSHSSPSLTS